MTPRHRLFLGGAVALLAILAGLVVIGAFDDWGTQTYPQRRLATLGQASLDVSPSASAPAPSPAASMDIAGDPPHAELVASTDAVSATREVFRPPSESQIPVSAFGEVIRRGREIFVDTARAAPAYVGNSLRCVNCHLDAGRLAGSSPLWAAFVSYPAYRSKTQRVSTFQQRLQGCFEYSMNGKAPPPGAPELVALESYAYWLATGAVVDPKLPGRGYPALPAPAQGRDYMRGEQVYTANCAFCHGAGGAGQRSADGVAVFPPLWGPESFNWGAGMGRINNAAAFIKANMPLGMGGTLTEQQAWDVALYMNSHERPQDPRYSGSVQATRAAFHDTDESMYGRDVAGMVLGATGAPQPFKPSKVIGR
jgi:thiosulfate dehydrogenase